MRLRRWSCGGDTEPGITSLPQEPSRMRRKWLTELFKRLLNVDFWWLWLVIEPPQSIEGYITVSIRLRGLCGVVGPVLYICFCDCELLFLYYESVFYSYAYRNNINAGTTIPERTSSAFCFSALSLFSSLIWLYMDGESSIQVMWMTATTMDPAGQEATR